MTTADILKIRLYNQLLSGNRMKEAHEIVSHMGAMQSQAFDMARWAIGVRLSGSTDRDIANAINSGTVIRTHILRPTWHFVAAEDIHWMFDLSSPRIRPVYLSYYKMNRIEESHIRKTNRIIEKALIDHNHLTKTEITEVLQAEGIDTDPYIISQILSRAEIDGIICNGRIKEKKQTFALLHEWAPKTNTLSKEEALEKLARKFFTSHAPATLQDFIWWSGLLASDCKKALELIKDNFISEEFNGKTFRMKNDLTLPPESKDSALLLPQFDELVVSYKDRSEMIEDEHYGKVMTKNGLFSPTVMLNGKIIGSWRKVMNKKKPEVEISFFEKTPKKTEELFKEAKKRYVDFLRK